MTNARPTLVTPNILPLPESAMKWRLVAISSAAIVNLVNPCADESPEALYVAPIGVAPEPFTESSTRRVELRNESSAAHLPAIVRQADVVLDAESSLVLAELLAHPPEPTPGLRRALRRRS